MQQDESLASRAPKLAKADGTVNFDQAACMVRARIHGLTPWPGCTVQLGDATVKLLRVQEVPAPSSSHSPGTVLDGGMIVCGECAVRVLELQPPGGRGMSWDEFVRGRNVQSGTRCEAV